MSQEPPDFNSMPHEERREYEFATLQKWLADDEENLSSLRWDGPTTEGLAPYKGGKNPSIRLIMANLSAVKVSDSGKEIRLPTTLLRYLGSSEEPLGRISHFFIRRSKYQEQWSTHSIERVSPFRTNTGEWLFEIRETDGSGRWFNGLQLVMEPAQHKG